MPKLIREGSIWRLASAGNGTQQHLAGELFRMMAGVSLTHVPYRGSAPALADLIAGQVQVAFDTTAASDWLHQGGQVAGTCSNLEYALGSAARCACAGRFCARLRGKWMVWRRCA